jgi:hypothetical protein
MAVVISVTIVVTKHTTRFDIRTVHQIIIFFWEVTQFDMRQQLERAYCLSLRSTLKMEQAYFLERRRSRRFGEAEILIGPAGYLTTIPQAPSPQSCRCGKSFLIPDIWTQGHVSKSLSLWRPQTSPGQMSLMIPPLDAILRVQKAGTYRP